MGSGVKERENLRGKSWNIERKGNENPRSGSQCCREGRGMASWNPMEALEIEFLLPLNLGNSFFLLNPHTGMPWEVWEPSLGSLSLQGISAMVQRERLCRKRSCKERGREWDYFL